MVGQQKQQLLLTLDLLTLSQAPVVCEETFSTYFISASQWKVSRIHT